MMGISRFGRENQIAKHIPKPYSMGEYNRRYAVAPISGKGEIMIVKSLVAPAPRTLWIVLFSAATAIISFGFYLQTVFPTITWWDSAEYSLAAGTLSVSPAPGCLLGVIVGWVVTRPFAGSAVPLVLNLLAAAAASLTAVLVGIIAATYLRREDSPIVMPASRQVVMMSLIGGGIGALTLAFADTFWTHAVMFTPYIFTVLLTAVILWAMIQWWNHADRPSAWRWLFLVTLLFGLDFSVHRTNLLLAPGLIVWMLLRSPRVFLLPRTWLYGAGGLIAGFLVHMIVIPMAAARPFMNISDPSSWGRFWDYVSLQQAGGGFLVQFLPRNAPFWTVQIADYLKSFSINFFSPGGPIPLVGLLPGLLGVVGIVGTWRRRRKMTIGLAVLFLLSSLGAVLYFNIPAGFFRPMYRHYMPSFVIFAVWIAYGAGSVLVWAVKRRRPVSSLVYPLVVVLVLALPGFQIAKNLRALDASRHYFAYDYAQNLLRTLPDKAVLFTSGDNDTFTLWYLQAVEKVRPDVTVLNMPLLNTPLFVRHVMNRYPDLPLVLDEAQIAGLTHRPWPDTTVQFPVYGTAADFQLPRDVLLPSSATFHIPPQVAGQYLLPQDQVILNIMENNRWQRPLYFVAGGGPAWLQDHLRMEGLTNRLLPVADPPVDEKLLKQNLIDKYAYRGYSDPGVRLDETSRTMGFNYLAGFLQLAYAPYQRGDSAELSNIRMAMTTLIPPERLRPIPEGLNEGLKNLLGVAPGGM
jgi:hypothetical protein